MGILIGATPNYASTLARDPLSQRGEDSPSRPLPARGYGLTNARRSVGHVGRDVVAPPKGSRRRARASVGPGRDWLGADSDRYFVLARCSPRFGLSDRRFLTSVRSANVPGVGFLSQSGGRFRS